MWFRRCRPRRKLVVISIVLLLGFSFIYWCIICLANFILMNSKFSHDKIQKPIRPRYGMNVIVGHYIGTGNLFNNYSRDVLNENNFRPIHGEGDNGKPVVISARDILLMQQKYQINRYNLLASDRIPLNRTLPDVRRKKCITKKYAGNLPTTSVIIVFHNEAWSVLLRTIWSVINRSPSYLLEEIILVDDASDREFLKTQLNEYVAKLPIKTSIIRQEFRKGLVPARLLGAHAAKGMTLTFLDAHCECTVGWLEPLLARVAEDRRKVVCPVIDIISDDNFGYIKSFELHWGAFNWQLHFRWYLLSPSELKKRTNNNIQPFATPAMAGGLFTIERNYFYEIGAYDDEMKIWGGDNLELSFRIWQCGGQIEIIPCSHVGHLFRKSSPYTFPGGVDKILNENLSRTALVWMDDWSTFFFKINNIPMEFTSNLNTIKRQELRKKLQCRNFDWYLSLIWPNHFFPHKNRFFGKITMIDSSSETHYNYLNLLTGYDLEFNNDWPYTIEFLNKKIDQFEGLLENTKVFCLFKGNNIGGFKQINLQTCENNYIINELLIVTGDGQVMMNEGICLDSYDKTDDKNDIKTGLRLANCADSRQQIWLYDVATQEIIQKATDLCLTGSPLLKNEFQAMPSKTRQSFNLTLAPCSGLQYQKWLLFPMKWTEN